jgi:thiol:disulfide interchange protein DsbC
MKISKLAVLTAAVLMATTAYADPSAAKKAPANEAELKKVLEPRLGQGVKIDSIRPTPYSDLQEVRIGSDILYTDKKGEYLFVGRVLATKNMEDLTKARVDLLTKVKFSELPLADSIKVVRGDGKRSIAVFEDPNCGYCKKFRQTVAGLDNVTVYTFLYNVLSEDSAVKSKNIWCSADRKQALEDWMINGKEPATAAADCQSPNDRVSELGRKLKVTGTPTIIFADGSRIPGFVESKVLEQKLASVK